MRKWAKRAFWTVAAAIGVPLSATLFLYLIADTGPGRTAIEGLVSLFSGGDVRITSLDGSFPNTPRAARVEIRDTKGVWLTLDNVTIEWSPWGFFSDDVPIAKAHAAHATLLRFPVSRSTSNTPDTTRYEIGSLIIDRADFARELTGRPFTIAVKGRGHYTNKSDAQWVLVATRLGGGGSYHSTGTIDANSITATIIAREPAHGLLASLAGLPDIGAVTIDARIKGRRAAESLVAAVRAGPAQLSARGRLDLQNRFANLDVSAHGPTMAPRRDLSWSSFAFDGHLRGSFDRPEADGHLSVEGLNAFGGGAHAIAGDLSGTGGAVTFIGTADGVRIPGREPGVLASAPLHFTVDARLDGAAPEGDFSLSHPLLALKGHAILAQHTTANATVTLARVGPFAALGGIDLDGSALLTARLDSARTGDTFSVDGTINAGGPALLSRLLGRGAQVSLAAKTDVSGFTIDKAHIKGAALTFDAKGNRTDDMLDFAYTAAVSDVSRLLRSLVGRFTSQGQVQGDVRAFTVTASAEGSIATRGYDQGPVTLSLVAQNLPDLASGTLDLRGRLDAAQLKANATFAPRGSGVLSIALQTLEWRSIRAKGDFILPLRTRAITGSTEFHIGQLADIGLLIGETLKGTLHGTAGLASEGGRSVGHLHANATGIGYAGISSQTLDIDGRIIDPFGKPDAALTLKAGGLATGGVSGNATAQLNGPIDALRVTLASDLKNGDDSIPLVGDATLDLDSKTATLARLETTYRGEPFRLTAPAHVDFAAGLAVDRLQLLSNQAEIRIAGRILPTLALDLTLRNASPTLIRIFVPSLDAEGIISGGARLSGTLAAPVGTVALQATGFRMRGEASGLPPATIIASGILQGRSMTLTARIDAGKAAHLALNGSVPLEAAGNYAINANGTVDLTVLDPVLAANGRRLRGLVTLDGRFTGNFSAPRASGTATLAKGEFADFQQGIRVTDLAAAIEAKGDSVTIRSFSGRAGRGTISGNGVIALWADGIPLDLTVTLVNARPIATDLFTADLNANLKLTGNLRERLTLSGNARIARGEINIAESYPPEVAELDVRRSRNAPAPKPPPPRTAIALDLVVSANNQIFVRGRGLDAQAGGTLTVKGTSNAPIVVGGFTMRRGELSLAGQTIKFTSGRISFDGQSISGSFDPALDFAAESTSGSVTAKLAITGHASAPRIALSSSPTLPQDEVLAHLLFSASVSQLNPFQLAQIAQAFAALGGIGGGFNPLGSVRRTLGLDRLAVSSATSGNGATIEVGKNIGGNIYVGAKQDTAGGTQAIVQVDLTEHLKLQSTVTAVASAAPTTGTAAKQDNGSSVGLSYQFEY